MRTLAAALCAVMLLLFSDAAMQSARAAAQTFASGVMPALFPMMVLCRLLPSSHMGKGSRFPLSAVMFGFLAGSPASAQRAEGMRKGGMSQRHFERLLALTGVMSPMFFTGTLAGWMNCKSAAWIMLGAHWLGAAVAALLWERVPADDRAQAAEGCAQERVTLPEAIIQSARSLLAVCGAMMLFSIAAGVAGRCLHGVLSAKALAVLWAVMEIGSGAKAVTEAFPDAAALLCGLCSFGGLSIWLQNLLFVGESIRPARLLGMRALHGAVSYSLCTFFLKIQNLLMT